MEHYMCWPPNLASEKNLYLTKEDFNMKYIEIEIDPEGNIVATTKGFQGKSCVKVAEALCKIGETTHKEKTKEYFAENTETERNF